MDIKRTGIILLTGIGIISSALFPKGDTSIPYTLEREDIRRVLEIEKAKQILISSGQAVDEVGESIKDKEIKEGNIDKDYLIEDEKLNSQDIQAKDNTEENDIIIAEKPQTTPSRGNSSTENRKDQEETIPKFNRYVLDVIKTYSLDNGKYPYLLNNDFENYNGVTEDLYYGGEVLLKANPNGNRASNCTGITFEVFFKAMQKKNQDLGLALDDFNGMNKEELLDFVLTWFVAKGDKAESNLALAIEKYGFGKRIYDLEELRSGDFMDLSRENNTGHAVIFMDWIRKEGEIIGFKYWSSQGSTKGISYKEEYFNIKDKNGNKYGNVIIDNLHLARVY